MVKIILPLSKKRGREPPETIKAECQKKRKMDLTVKVDCGKILRTLMTHEYGPIFNQPVDPVALRIPDYFSIISHPMDLGTIKRRLDGNRYFGAEEFAADVRLTFANAMQYNPPGNSVHLMAKAMNDVFKRNWEYLEAKWLRERKFITKHSFIINSRGKSTDDSSKGFHALPTKTSISSEEKTSVKVSRSIANGRAKDTEDVSKACPGALARTSISADEKVSLKVKVVKEQSFGADGRTKNTEDIGKASHGSLPKTSWFTPEFSKVVRQQKFCANGRTKNLQNRNGRSISLKVEDKSNIEARIRAARAAKEALLKNAKSEIRMKRERERERIEKMDRTATIEDNLMVLRELEKFCFVGQLGNHSLEIIGLRLKEEYQYVDDDLYEELEDGEIV